MGRVCLSDLPQAVSKKLSLEPKSTESESPVCPLTIKFFSALHQNLPLPISQSNSFDSQILYLTSLLSY